MKSGLAGILAHDINNLVAVIRGYIDLLSMEKDSLPDMAREGLPMARKAAVDITSLIQEVADTARIEDGIMPFVPEAAGIGPIIADAIEKAKASAADSQVALSAGDISQARDFMIDRNLISRTINILVACAIGSTPGGGSVTVSARADDDGLEVRVKDTGFGIPLEFREKIFDKDAMTEIKKANLKRGRGMALVFAKLAVGLHGGRIWVESPDGAEGSVFAFSIPRQKNTKA